MELSSELGSDTKTSHDRLVPAACEGVLTGPLGDRASSWGRCA